MKLAILLAAPLLLSNTDAPGELERQIEQLTAERDAARDQALRNFMAYRICAQARQPAYPPWLLPRGEIEI